LTNHYLGLARGPIDHEASSVINAVANAAIEMGASIVTVAPPASELLPRVSETTTAEVYGIVVGGDTDGIYSTTGAATGLPVNAASESAGQAVVVVTQGRCLAIVTGGSVLIGSLLESDTAGGLRLFAAGEVIARALQATTTTADIIAVDVQREGA
jgi:hypothetical protein